MNLGGSTADGGLLVRRRQRRPADDGRRRRDALVALFDVDAGAVGDADVDAGDAVARLGLRRRRCSRRRRRRRRRRVAGDVADVVVQTRTGRNGALLPTLLHE